jgi:cytoskeletal protein CcmA (bactofilin family)
MLGNRKKCNISKIDTLIGAESEIQGDLHFTGGLHVDGRIKGNVVADGDAVLMLSEHGSIEGEVRVPHIVLNGTVTGDVHAAERIELASKARVRGNVFYQLIEMVVGAEVNGKLVHSAQAQSGDIPDTIEVIDNSVKNVAVMTNS